MTLGWHVNTHDMSLFRFVVAWAAGSTLIEIGARIRAANANAHFSEVSGSERRIK